jgi:hypothetical protein
MRHIMHSPGHQRRKNLAQKKLLQNKLTCANYLKRCDNFFDARCFQETVNTVYNIGGMQVVVVQELWITCIVVFNLHKKTRTSLLGRKEKNHINFGKKKKKKKKKEEGETFDTA